MSSDQNAQLVFERLDVAGERPDLCEFFACDAGASGCLKAAQVAIDLVECSCLVERAAFE
jgi:hypothetical protein